MTGADAAEFLEALPMPALLVGAEETILAVNAAARALWPSAQVGRHYATALRQPAALEAVEACLGGGDGRSARFDLGETALRMMAAPLALEEGGGVLLVFEDLTPIEAADRVRRDFVANVSHELRTPLTSLLGFIETLRGPARGDAEATDRFLATMAREAARMERLVGDLLSLSRVESEERMRPRDDVDLAALLRSVRHTLEPAAEEAGAAIALDLPEGAVTVPGDADRLRQVFLNLMENAIKYGGDRVQVSLSVTGHEPALRGPAAIVTVRDAGRGIAAEHIPRLTERFYRVDNHRSRQMGGTGLGLAIVKHIVNRHRGRLRIESAPGAGSTFTVILPR